MTAATVMTSRRRDRLDRGGEGTARRLRQLTWPARHAHSTAGSPGSSTPTPPTPAATTPPTSAPPARSRSCRPCGSSTAPATPACSPPATSPICSRRRRRRRRRRPRSPPDAALLKLARDPADGDLIERETARPALARRHRGPAVPALRAEDLRHPPLRRPGDRGHPARERAAAPGRLHQPGGGRRALPGRAGPPRRGLDLAARAGRHRVRAPRRAHPRRGPARRT